MTTTQMKYFDVLANWRAIKRHLHDPVLNEILVRDFNKFTFGRWGAPFTSGMFPADFETCDWRHRIRGRHPSYFKYVKHAACHWLCNFNLRLAQLAAPAAKWRIVTSDAHSTVWDGQETLFDLNFLALRIEPEECFALANEGGEHLPVGRSMEVAFASHYKEDLGSAA